MTGSDLVYIFMDRHFGLIRLAAAGTSSADIRLNRRRRLNAVELRADETTDQQLVEGVRRSSMEELTAWTVEAGKVISF